MDRMNWIKIYHEEKLSGKDRVKVDAVTWDDLEMDEVFEKINHTKSYAGEQILYHRLHQPEQVLFTEKSREQIRYMTENENDRQKIKKQLSQIGKREGDYYLPAFLIHPELWTVRGCSVIYLPQIMLVCALAGSLFTEQAEFSLGLLIIIPVNLMVYLMTKQRYEILIYSLGSLRQLIKFCKVMTADVAWRQIFGTDEIEAAVKDVKCLSGMIGSWQGRKRQVMTGDTFSLLQDYLFGITLCDVASFNRIMKHIDKKQDKVLLLYEFTGYVDMLAAIASFRETADICCEPLIWEKHRIDMEGIVHPLLENPVPNDFMLSGEAMITGANAAGKSTFMKAVAVNVILAQTIFTCTAQSFCLPNMKVMTSMSVRDDLQNGESYYIREAKYLKRMLDDAGKKELVLFVIDEMLRGTNRKERLAASYAILDYFAETGNFVIAANHDTELVDELRDIYESYYFTSDIETGDVIFDYKIHRGSGGSSNALTLLSLLGYPQEIIRTANEKRNRRDI